MIKDFDNMKEGQVGLGKFLKGFLGILIRPLIDILVLTHKEIYGNLINKKWKEFSMAILPIALIFSFIIYGFTGIYKDAFKVVYSDRYEEVITQNYIQEIEDFFKKYEERFRAHDCKFMAEVAADELMYDKWGNESYPEGSYDCSIFDSVQKIKMLPISIKPIEKVGNKLKVQGELIRVEITNGKPLIIAPIRFELWKTAKMDLWHFNLYGNPENRWIDSQFKENYK